MMRRRSLVSQIACACLLAACLGSANAADAYPARPIRLVLGVGATMASEIARWEQVIQYAKIERQ